MTVGPFPPRREPALNIPGVVTALIALMAVIHLVRAYLLSPDQDWSVLLLFSFIPIRYAAIDLGVQFPGGGAAELWTPVTYGLLHGDLTHLLVNSVWLAAFGSALAWRLGAARFLAFSLGATVAGAAAHYLAHPSDFVPMVGASGAISGHMAAVSRFMFQPGGMVPANRHRDRANAVPALPLSGIVRDKRVLLFLAIWFGLNLLFGSGAVPIAGEGAEIAWEAHVGGFLFGLFFFSAFDPARPKRRTPAVLDEGENDRPDER